MDTIPVTARADLTNAQWAVLQLRRSSWTRRCWQRRKPGQGDSPGAIQLRQAMEQEQMTVRQGPPER